MRHALNAALLGLLALLASTPASAEGVKELLEAVAVNARFETPARADIRIECQAGCERAAARAVLFGRGDTLYIEVKDGVRALLRPGEVLLAQNGSAVASTAAHPLADSDLLLEDLVVPTASSLRFPQISDDGPAGVVVMGAPAERSSYALLVYTIDRGRRAIVKTQYYKDDVSTLAKIRRDTTFVQVGRHWRPGEVVVESMRSGAQTRIAFSWKEVPDAPPAIFEAAGLERPSTVVW
jgi:hypothetical protein